MASNRDDPLTLRKNPSSSDQFRIGIATASSSDAEFGFTRPEFGQSPLAGTVQFYERHLFLCYKNPSSWPSKIEAAEFDVLPRMLSAAVSFRKRDMRKKTRLTLCGVHDRNDASNGDVLIFPDMIRYRRMNHFDVESFVEEVLVKDGEWLPGAPEPLHGSYVFVCCHGSHDRRCGICGPQLISRFKEEIELHGLQSKVSVSPCSHLGGHKYAGNVIVFGPNTHGEEVTGHWYGYVAPDDVPTLLEQHIARGEIVNFLWRGQMGLSEEEQKKFQELRLQVKCDINEDRSTWEESCCQKKSQAQVFGCCQGNDGASCCQNPVLPEKGNARNANHDSVKLNLENDSKKLAPKM